MSKPKQLHEMKTPEEYLDEVAKEVTSAYCMILIKEAMRRYAEDACKEQENKILSTQDVSIWKDVLGYEGLYKVNNLGQVKSLFRPVKDTNLIAEERIMRQRLNRTGYCYIILYREGKRLSKTIHRLVAEAFIENVDNKPFVNHIDCNPQNNNLNNLEWCTAKENSEHAKRLGRVRTTGCDVIDTISGKKFRSIKKACEYRNLDYSKVRKMMCGMIENTSGILYVGQESILNATSPIK